MPMTREEPSPEDHWEHDREELHWLARLHLSPRLRGKVDPSDIVQQTLLKACERGYQCRSHNGAERTAWLRRILANTLADALRTFGYAKRDVALERSLEAALEESSVRLRAMLRPEPSSPSQQAVRQEGWRRLSGALEQLPADQRAVIEMHHLQGLPVPEVAEHLQRSEAAVAGLLRRGLKKLRQLLGEPT
jgi:RNA polymerase sigma-70 factor (ECF subfamily)